MNRFHRLRRVIFWSHLVTGLAAALFIFIIAGTGVILSFERQIIEAREKFPISVPGTAPRLNIPDLHKKLLEDFPGEKPTSVTLKSDPAASITFQSGRNHFIHLNPYTGENLGSGAVGTRKFFHQVVSIHRWLIPGEKKSKLGHTLNSAAALIFFFLILSGLILWIPKRLTKRGLKAITKPSLKLRGRARDWNWHNVLGFWSSLPLLLICATGLVIAYPWANALLLNAFGESPPPAKEKSSRPRRAQPEGPLTLPPGISEVLTIATSTYPGWESIQVSLPKEKTRTVKLTIADSHRGRPDLRHELTGDLATGEITEIKDMSDQPRARQLRIWNRWIHTGEVGGWVGQLFSAIVCLNTLVLIYTGCALSYRRFRKKKPVAA